MLGCFHQMALHQSGGDAMYRPVPLAHQTIPVSPSVQAELSRAEICTASIEARARASGASAALSRALARTEALSSVRIEGLKPSVASLFFLEAFLNDASDGEERLNALDVFDFGNDETRQAAVESIRYVRALDYIYEEVQPGTPITCDTLLDIHSIAEHGTRASIRNTRFRDAPVKLAHQAGADYLPPPPEEIQSLMEDLCAFINQDLYSPIAQAAIAHFQFEEIRPFKSGLDKTGRLMCHAILRRRGLIGNVVVPIGLAPAADTKSHAESLLPYQALPEQRGQMAALNQWISFCAKAAEISSKTADVYLDALGKLRDTWQETLGKISRGSTTDALLNALAMSPALTARHAAAMTGKSISSVNEALHRLESAGIVSLAEHPQKAHVYTAPLSFAILDRIDRLVSPDVPVSRDSFTSAGVEIDRPI